MPRGVSKPLYIRMMDMQMNEPIQFRDADNVRNKTRLDEPYFRLPSWFCRCGLLRRVRGTTIKVLCAIAARAENYTHRAWPTNKMIAEEAGVSETSVSAITHELALLGLLNKCRRGYR